MGKIAQSWTPVLPFTWEWTREVTAVPQDTHPLFLTGDASMSIYIEDYRHYCRIQVPPSAQELSDEELEESILHEIGHLFMLQPSMARTNEIIAHGGEASYKGQWVDAEEVACWRFAHLLLALKERP